MGLAAALPGAMASTAVGGTRSRIWPGSRQLHLRDGELDGARILSRAATASMWQVTARGRRYDLGLGWFRPASQRDADPPFVEHLSGGAGFFNRSRSDAERTKKG